MNGMSEHGYYGSMSDEEKESAKLAALTRIADALERGNEIAERAAKLRAWATLRCLVDHTGNTDTILTSIVNDAWNATAPTQEPPNEA